MNSKKAFALNRGFLAGVIAVAVLALGVGIGVKYMYSVSANPYDFGDLYSTFTRTTCDPSERAGDPVSRTSYYREVDSSSSATEGVSKTYDVIGADINNPWYVLRVTLNLKNTSSSTKNFFSRGDMLKLSLNVENIGSYRYAFKPQFYVHFIDAQTNLVLDNGVIGGEVKPQVIEVGRSARWQGNQQYLVPQNLYGKLRVRLIDYIATPVSFKKCGPAINVWEFDLGPAGGSRPSPVVSISPSPSETPSETATANGNEVIMVRRGFNAYSIPASAPILDTTAFRNAGMKVFAFNLRGQRSWNTDIDTQRIIHRIGYYIYNPGKGRIMKIARHPDQNEPLVLKMQYGWNLFANEKDTNQLLKAIDVEIPCSSGDSGCQDGFIKVKMSDLFAGSEANQKAYKNIFVIVDPYATDPNVAFEALQVTNQNRNTAKIPPRKLYWVYLWPN